ncbi:MAG: ABC transporter permease, partial [Candidatus Rokubacteria bacterium]|nr:ABC transporter permease [Candidatus Rokubacteria bacterium]
MLEYLIQRLAISAVTLAVISLIVFTCVRMIPGDPARVMAGTEADEAGLAEIREKYGLNDPIPVQYFRWVGLAIRGDLGESIRTRETVTQTVAKKLPITLELACLSILVALTIAIPVGVLSAVRRNTLWDYVANGLSLCGLSVPSFWLGIMLILFFSVRLGWLPASGFVSFFQDPVANLTRMIMPAFVLGTALAAVLMRQTRNSMIEVLSADYIRTAYSKGLAGRVVVFRHAIRNGLIPVVT